MAQIWKLKPIQGFRFPRKGDTPFLESSPARQESNVARLCPFPVSPEGKAGVGGRPHAAKKQRVPLQEGFQKRPAENPMLSPGSKPRHTKKRCRFAEGRGMLSLARLIPSCESR